MATISRVQVRNAQNISNRNVIKNSKSTKKFNVIFLLLLRVLNDLILSYPHIKNGITENRQLIRTCIVTSFESPIKEICS